MGKRTIHTDYKKAKEVVKNVISMSQTEMFPFQKTEELFPDAILPRGIDIGSREHSLFLFYGCGLDAMRLADQVYKGIRGLASEIDLGELHKLGDLELATLLSKHLEPSILERFKSGKTLMGDPVKFVKENSQRLHDVYYGDPRTIVAQTIRTTRARMQTFYGIGLGKSALLLKNYNRFGISEFKEERLPIKVDRHVKRISIGSGVVILTENDETIVRGDSFLKALEEVYLRVTRREGISGIELDDNFWRIGRYLCKFNDDIVCKTSCMVGCQIRPPSDNGAVYFNTTIDKRRNKDNLFRYFSQQNGGNKNQ